MAFRTTIAVSVWMGCVVAAMGALQKYANTPGVAAAAPQILTLELIEPVSPYALRPRVLLFLHERCPCTRSSIEELSRQQRHLEGVRLDIVFSGPATGSDARESIREFVRTKLPNALIRDDPNGDMARSFGAYTSGFAAMYREDGTLHFSGGLTPSRAHAGPCLGITALHTLTADPSGEATSAPVFGCPLFSDACLDADYCGAPTP